MPTGAIVVDERQDEPPELPHETAPRSEASSSDATISDRPAHSTPSPAATLPASSAAKTATGDATIPVHPGDASASAPSAASTSNAPISRIGDYDILGEIARGGMGVVYKARQRSLGRIVAVKTLLSGQMAGDDDTARFRREAEAAALLDHPHIVPVHEVGQFEGRHFFSMGYVEGESLATRVARSPLTSREAAELVRTVALAVHYAHDHGIVHRDLKPANVLLDRDGAPKVTDFGLAKRLDADAALTATGEVMGTPSYMAPEQAAGDSLRIGPQSDVYSLGGILYFAVTGSAPFQAARVYETIRQVIEREPVPPRQLNPAIDRDVETICLHCLTKEPGKRFASAAELAEELGRYLSGQTLRIRPASAPERVSRWCRRNPVVASLATLLVVSLLVGTGFAVGFGIWAGVNRNEAVVQRGIAESQRDKARQEEQRATGLAAIARAEEARAAEQAKIALREERRATALAEQARQEADRAMRHFHGAQMLLAHDRWKSAQIDSVRAILSATRPDTGTDDYRGFEWYYFRSLLDRHVLSIKHSVPYDLGGELETLAFSPDDRLLAFAGWTGPPRMVSVDTGRDTVVIAAPDLIAEEDTIYSLSWRGDGKRVATVSMFGRAQIWNVETGKVERSWEVGGIPNQTAWGPDGVSVAVVGYHERSPTQIWDAESGNVLLSLGTSEILPWDIAWSADGDFVAAVASRMGADGEYVADEPTVVKVWNARTGEEALSFRGHSMSAYCVAYAPAGGKLATGSRDGTIIVWDARDGRLLQTLVGHESHVNSLAWNSDGTRLASSGEDRIVRVWDPATGRLLRSFRGHAGRVSAVDWSGDGRLLASASEDKTVKLWRADDDQEVTRLTAAGDSVRWRVVSRFQFSPGGDHLAVVGTAQWNDAPDTRQTLAVYALSQGMDSAAQQPHVAQLPGKVAVDGDLRWSDDGSRVAVVVEEADPFADNQLMIAVAAVKESGIELLNRLRIGQAGLVRLDRSLHRAAVSALTTAQSTAATPITIWNLESGEPATTLDGLKGRVLDIQWEHDGERLAAHDATGAILVWDVSNPVAIANWRGASAQSRRSTGRLRWSPDGRYLASGTSEVVVYRVDDGGQMLSIREAGYADFNGNGSRLWVTTTSGGQMFDTQSWQEVVSPSRGYQLTGGAAWSPDGGRIAAASLPHDVGVRGTSLQGLIHLWDVSTGLPVLTLEGESGYRLYGPEFSGDGRRLAAISESGTLLVWDASAGYDAEERAAIAAPDATSTPVDDSLRPLTTPSRQESGQ